MLFVGISGHIGCGKTTLAKKLMKGVFDQGRIAACFSFGTALKSETAEIFGIGTYQASLNESKKLPIADICDVAGLEYANTLLHLDPKDTYRTLLQEYAQYRRKENPDYWIRATDIQIKNAINKNCEFIFIDDVRQPNEFRWITETKKGIMIRLEDYPNYLSQKGGDHAVEHMLDNLNEFPFYSVIHPAFGALDDVAKYLTPRIFDFSKKGKE